MSRPLRRILISVCDLFFVGSFAFCWLVVPITLPLALLQDSVQELISFFWRVQEIYIGPYSLGLCKSCMGHSQTASSLSLCFALLERVSGWNAMR